MFHSNGVSTVVDNCCVALAILTVNEGSHFMMVSQGRLIARFYFLLVPPPASVGKENSSSSLQVIQFALT